MKTHTIPSENWVDFLDRFSRDHLGWPTTLEVLDRQSGAFKMAENQPLVGISLGQKGSRPSAVEIGVGDNLHHVIDLPLSIREAEEPNGTIDLEFEAAAGPITLVHVNHP